MINGILFVLTTGCTWHDVPANYGMKSTVHRFLLYFAEHGIYLKIFFDLLRECSGRSNRSPSRLYGFPANMPEYQAYKPTLDTFTIPEVFERPMIISADAACDARGICQYK